MSPSRASARRVSQVLLAAAATCLACEQTRPPLPNEMRGATYAEPLAKPEFTLHDTRGELFSFLEDTEGFVSLLFFGYTYCPDVCPIHMANIATVLKTLPPDIGNQVKVVMITTDPARDSPERLRAWLDNFDVRFVGLLGTLDEVNTVQAMLRLPPAQIGEGENYLVGHSARVIAFTKDNRAHVGYPFGIRQADWAHDIPLLVNRDWTER